MPCHNEEANIEPLVTTLGELFGDYVREIVLVDDNSSDRTAKVIRALAERNARVRPVFRGAPNGVGRAIAAGYKAASGAWFLSMDCDFRHLLPEVRDLFDAADEGLDVVIGSRFTRHRCSAQLPFSEDRHNRGFHLLARLILRRRFRDLTNNLKLIRREVIEQLILNQPHFAVNAETGLQPLMMGCRVREVPISWVNRTPEMGYSSFKLLKVGGDTDKCSTTSCSGRSSTGARTGISHSSAVTVTPIVTMLIGRSDRRPEHADAGASPARYAPNAHPGCVDLHLCTVLRLTMIERQGLWTDELFSLAMATGHSLEHPADQAESAHGDYIEAPGPVPSSQLADISRARSGAGRSSSCDPCCAAQR